MSHILPEDFGDRSFSLFQEFWIFQIFSNWNFFLTKMKIIPEQKF